MESFVFVPHDLEAVKIITTAVFGGHLVAVDGSYDDVNRLCAEIASEYPAWAFVNVNLRPYYAEGSKTLAFEVAEQLGWQLPDHVVVPIASGSQLTKVDKGFRELAPLGLVDAATTCASRARRPRVARRSRRPSPTGADHIRPVKPRDDRQVARHRQPRRRLVRARGGAPQRGRIAAVTDEEIIEGIRLLARTEGIFAETAGGVTMATLAKLAADGDRPARRARRRLHHRQRAQDRRGARRRRRAVGDDRARRSTPSRACSTPTAWRRPV